jgi:hypothetical protein
MKIKFFLTLGVWNLIHKFGLLRLYSILFAKKSMYRTVWGNAKYMERLGCLCEASSYPYSFFNNVNVLMWRWYNYKQRRRYNFFVLQSIGLISLPNIFVRVQYLIIFGFQKGSEFLTYFWITKLFSAYRMHAHQKARSPSYHAHRFSFILSLNQ